jgi:hypothetical protein
VVACATIPAAELVDRARHLAELHAAASWLWPALVARLIAEGWNVDTARGHAGRLEDAPEPPSWADAEAIAQALVEGAMRPGDVDRMAKAAQDAARPHGRQIERRVERLEARAAGRRS